MKEKTKVYIYPTDTVWGIGGSIFSRDVYERINEIKKIEGKKPVSVLFSNVDEIRNFFDLPPELNNEWLRTFFTYETTLGLPLSWHKGSIPSWIYQESEIICIRCLEGDFFKELTECTEGPLITTSLNLNGEDPILSLVEAYSFQKKHAHDAVIKESLSPKLSGHSSTILALKGNSEFTTLREGFHFENVKKHLRLFSAQFL